jgi:hypothetical protein
MDEWIGVELTLAATEAADCAWAPVETVSLSEAGLERIYQGSSIVWCWPMRLAPGETRELGMTLALRAAAAA